MNIARSVFSAVTAKTSTDTDSSSFPESSSSRGRASYDQLEGVEGPEVPRKEENRDGEVHNSHSAGLSRKQSDGGRRFQAKCDELRKAKELQRAAEEREQATRKALKAAENELQALRQRYNTVKSQCQEYDANLRTQNRENEQLRQEVKATGGLRLEIEETKKKLHDTSNLLEMRTMELKDAQTFLGKTDGVSHTDVLSLLQTLNGEILQSSAHISETFASQRASPSVGEKKVSKSLRGRVTTTLGIGAEYCLSRVRQGSASDDVFIIQMVLQSLLTRYAEKIVSSWHLSGISNAGIGMDPGKSNASLLGGIHGAMFRSEPQAVSARWRVLTRQYIAASSSESGTTYLDPICRSILDNISDLLRISGIPVYTNDPKLSVDAAIAGKIKDILHRCVQLREYIGERVSSSDFVLVCPLPGVEFSTQWMYDAYNGEPQNSTVPNGKVLFVTELGMYRREKVAKPAPEQPDIIEAFPTKAGVFLESSVSELFGDQDAMECS